MEDPRHELEVLKQQETPRVVHQKFSAFLRKQTEGKDVKEVP